MVSERPINRADITLSARVVGGLQMIDGGEADDKIMAVLVNDLFWGGVEEIINLPPTLIDRLAHYFSTYKPVPGRTTPATIAQTYGRDHTARVVEASMADYLGEYGG